MHRFPLLLDHTYRSHRQNREVAAGSQVTATDLSTAVAVSGGMTFSARLLMLMCPKKERADVGFSFTGRTDLGLPDIKRKFAPDSTCLSSPSSTRKWVKDPEGSLATEEQSVLTAT